MKRRNCKLLGRQQDDGQAVSGARAGAISSDGPDSLSGGICCTARLRFYCQLRRQPTTSTAYVEPVAPSALVATVSFFTLSAFASTASAKPVAPSTLLAPVTLFTASTFTSSSTTSTEPLATLIASFIVLTSSADTSTSLCTASDFINFISPALCTSPIVPTTCTEIPPLLEHHANQQVDTHPASMRDPQRKTDQDTQMERKHTAQEHQERTSRNQDGIPRALSIYYQNMSNAKRFIEFYRTTTTTDHVTCPTMVPLEAISMATNEPIITSSEMVLRKQLIQESNLESIPEVKIRPTTVAL